MHGLTNAGTTNVYHTATELIQSSYEHNSQLKILQPSLPKKSTPLPAIVPKMEQAKEKQYGGIVGLWVHKKFGQYFRGNLQEKDFNSFIAVYSLL